MTDNNTTDNNKRIAELLSELFLKAADEAAGKMAVGQDSIEELVTTSVVAAIESNELDAVDEDTVRSICDDAMDDRIGRNELITEDNFNDWLEDADALNCLAREDYVDDSIMYAIDELESEIVCADRVRDMIKETAVTLDVVNQMMRDLETDIEAAKLSNRIKRRVELLFTLTRASIKSLLSFRITRRKVEG